MTPEQFKRFRKRMGLNQKQVAERLGVSVNMPSAYESGKSVIPRYIALACTAVLLDLPEYGFDVAEWAEARRANTGPDAKG